MDDDGVDTEETVAPTAFLHFKKKELKRCEAKKKKQHTVTKKISDLTKERDSLCQQVGQNNSGTTDSSSSANTSPGASSFSSSFSSFSSSSSSTSSTAFSDQKLKKKRKNKKMHRHRSQKKKDKRKKKKTQREHSRQRARHPQEVIKRYKKVLKAYKKGRKLSLAYQKVGVDRNTIVSNAPICELAVVAPKTYKELLGAHTPQQRLQDFSKKCLEVINSDPNLLRDVEHQKKKGKLIPLSRKA
ncbi:coiled-coil domain-containing protein 106-like isoform X1 [Oryzias latipes]|uniref:coiled-coil domain-containing protein 106-like isoform X1 n=1 Tax=Oryzias latipes TaxID=8090 RepID=UPI000CE1DA92|nr:coiled-coil domain-containing protein 106-like isoform X1 [Oryzias latipes]